MIEGVDLEHRGVEEVLAGAGAARPGPGGAGVGVVGVAHRAMTRVRARRRWRGLDLGMTRVYLEADATRVCCAEHGVVGGRGALGAARGPP